VGTIVITGAAGFIGNALARRLTLEGHDVVGVDDFSSGQVPEVAQGVPIRSCDVRDAQALDEVLPSSIDTIFHCAAQSSGEVSFDDPWDDMTRHIHATIRLLELSIARRARHFVYTSSMAAYGAPVQLPVRETDPLSPTSFYGAGKAAAEDYVRLFASGKMAITILRPFSIYGPGQDLANLRQGMVSIYLSQLLRSGRVLVKGSLERFRDFLFIEDAVNGYMSVLNNPSVEGSTLNLCSGEATTVREVLGYLLVQADADWGCVEVSDPTNGDQFGIFGDNSQLRSATDWSPLWSLQDGIEEMWRWAEASCQGSPA